MNALNSRKVVVGVAVTALVVVLHVLSGGGLGFLWPVVAICTGMAAGFVTPPRQEKVLEPPKAGEGELIHTLEEVRYTLQRTSFLVLSNVRGILSMSQRCGC